MNQKKKVFIALGSNIGEIEENMNSAVKKLRDVLEDLVVSNFIRTKAVGYTDQPDFLNGAISGWTYLSPEELLKTLKNLELEIGRKKRFRWGPREIDLDIIFYDNLIYKSENLEIPHPRCHERDFVLKPILELDKNLIFPNSKKSVLQVLHDLNNK